MSFAADLLDGFEVLYKRTDGGLKSTTELANFFKAIAKCEREYGKALSKVASAQKSILQKSPPPQKEFGTTYDAWDVAMNECEKMAEQHRLVADKLENDLAKTVLDYVKEKGKAKKKLETDGQRITKDMKTAIENLQKARAKYVQLSKEADAAEAVHTKGKGDMSMKPSQLAKLAAKASGAADKAASSDNEYQAALHVTNTKQAEFYTSTMPSLLMEFQQFEEDRLQNMKAVAEKFAVFNAETPTVYSSSAQAITAAAQRINVSTDVIAFINENKTGVSPPADIAYIPYDSDQPAVPQNKPSKAPKPSAKPSPKIGKYKGPQDGASSAISGDWGLSPADSNLTLQEKSTKLNQQLEELDKAIASETKAKEGLENLVRFYTSDPVAQKKAEDQIPESEEKLQKLMDLKGMVQSQLDNAGSDRPHLASSSGSIQARAIYNYVATCDTELSFSQNDVLTITERDESGWWYAELNGNAGFIPNNYVTPL